MSLVACFSWYTGLCSSGRRLWLCVVTCKMKLTSLRDEQPVKLHDRMHGFRKTEYYMRHFIVPQPFFVVVHSLRLSSGSEK